MRIIERGGSTSPPLRQRRWDWTGTIPAPHVRDQGPFQACVSCALANMIEARHWIRRNTHITVVAGYVHKCLFGIGDFERSLDPGAALPGVKRDGIAVGPDAGFPVGPSVCTARDLFRIDDCGWLIGQNVILNHLVENGPLIATMRVEDQSFRALGSGIYQMPPEGAGRRYLHAVLLLGYDIDSGCISFLNSFGPSWGVGGVGKVRFGSGGLFITSSGAEALIA